MRLSLFLEYTQISIFLGGVVLYTLCDSEELFGVCSMVFPFILKGFPCKSGVLHLCIYFLVWVLFTYVVTIHIYCTIHIYIYIHIYGTIHMKDAKRFIRMPKTMKEAKWEEMDETTTSAIRLNLSDEVLNNNNVENCTTAKEIWKRLEELYMAKNLSNNLYLKELYNLHMSENTDTLQHLSKFNGLISQLL